jgi:cytoskeletal protein CcmA (bactofilin family)
MWKRDQAITPSDAPNSQSTNMVDETGDSGDEVVMDLGKSVLIKGELSASEDLTLYGQMEGSVTLPDHTLTIGPQANITATISAKAAVIMGAVTGDVTAKDRIDIRATGSVTGDIDSPRLAIAEGARLRGHVKMP